MPIVHSINNSEVMTPEIQSQVSPEIALDLLKRGNERFLQGAPVKRNLENQIAKTTDGQYPFAIILSCIDSRVPLEIIFDQGIGDIFEVKVAGNFVNEDILGSIEYACKVAGSKLVLVLGHTGCGAVKGACDNVELGNITQMLEKIMPSVAAVRTKPGEERNSKNSDFVNKVVARNVQQSIDQTRTNSEVLREMEDTGAISIVGAVYDVKSGKVAFFDE